jgi:hypothetical protein
MAKEYISKETLNKLKKSAIENLEFPSANLMSPKALLFDSIFKFSHIPYTLSEFDIILSKETIDTLEAEGATIVNEMMFAALEGSDMTEGIIFNLMKQDDEEGEEGTVTIGLDGEILFAP